MGEARTANRAATPAMLVACLAATVVLASCRRAPDPVANHQASAGPCVPATGNDEVQAAREASVARVFIDGSESMSGYVNPQLGRSQALADLLRLFERRLPSSSEYRRFGAAISEPLDRQELSRFSTPGAYDCRGCDNEESHIDEVLEEIAGAGANDLQIVVTDLWLDNRSFRGSDEVALGEPLRAILRSGRAVGLIGIRAPFRGPIFDVPGVGTYRDAQERPLLVLMVGPPDQLTQLYRALVESQSPAMAEDRLRFSLYRAAPTEAPLENGVGVEGSGVRRLNVVRHRAVQGVPQFQLSLRHAEQREGAIQGSFMRAPSLEGSVWEGDLFERTRIWRLASEEMLDLCAPGTWAELTSLGGAWRPGDEPGSFQFAIDHRIGNRLTAPGTYYLLAELGATQLTVPNPQTAWMEEWSLSPAQAPAFVQERPAVFKALNLGRLRTILDEELKRQLADDIRISRRTGFILRLEP